MNALRGQLLLPLGLAIAVLVSSLAVIRTKHENRALVNRLEVLRQERERIDMEWSQLQIEEATLAHNGRVERIAREQLGMLEPRDYTIVQSGAFAP